MKSRTQGVRAIYFIFIFIYLFIYLFEKEFGSKTKNHIFPKHMAFTSYIQEKKVHNDVLDFDQPFKNLILDHSWNFFGHC